MHRVILVFALPFFYQIIHTHTHAHLMVFATLFISFLIVEVIFVFGKLELGNAHCAYFDLSFCHPSKPCSDLEVLVTLEIHANHAF